MKIARLVLSLALLACSAEPGASPASDAVPPPPETEALSARGVRRLTANEYVSTVRALLGVESTSGAFPPDARQHGFTRNVAQIAEPVFVAALQASARDLARSVASERLDALAPCATQNSTACAEAFIAEFGARAFRRPLTADERERYRALYELASSGADFSAGIELVLAAMLQSPLLLYVSSLGQTDALPAVVRLAPHEIAAELSYAVAGAPPDADLLELATDGRLFSAEEREHQARRLLAQSDARFHYRRFVREWLGVDALSAIAKDARAYPDFPALRDAMVLELAEITDRTMVGENGALSALLAGGLGPAPAALSAFYADTPASEPDRPGRAGVLQLAGFLALYAHPNESAPVLRGASVLRRVLCRELTPPAELDLNVVFPPPDPESSTRERFSAHVTDPACAGCHAAIDAVGFTFENFDAVGRARSIDAGRPIETHGSITLDGTERALSDSVDLAMALASSREAEDCFARQVFRYLSGHAGETEERAFVRDAASLPERGRGSLIELAVLYVTRDAFIFRRHEG